jgi:F0F1-type ATP synthase alpha subunit
MRGSISLPMNFSDWNPMHRGAYPGAVFYLHKKVYQSEKL